MGRADAGELAARLAGCAEAVCRHYLSRGAREGGYWRVGDVHNTPGRSLHVRLRGPVRGPGAAGRWRDAATGEHGDLLDLIGLTCGLSGFAPAAQEARRFLGLRPSSSPAHRSPPRALSRPCARERAARLFAVSLPLAGTPAERYLADRAIMAQPGWNALRFHPRCRFRGEGSLPGSGPALIAAVTDAAGALTGVQRTWLDPAGFSAERLGKASMTSPRRALGSLAGHAVRFGRAGPVMLAGEGIETVLSLRSVWPTLPALAALSAGALGALVLPPDARVLLIACDRDAAGERAALTLATRAAGAGIAAHILRPALGDWNDDLRMSGPEAVREQAVTGLPAGLRCVLERG